jgi:AcrR family transcriptional regulator
MSRPTQYDREKALDAALQLFWKKGYHETSLKDLEVTLAMKPGSIYGAFTSKENLYLLTLERYYENSLARFRAHMERASSPLTGLAGHLLGFAKLAPEDHARQVCMLTRPLVATAATDPEIAAQTKGYLAAMRDTFAGAFERAKAQGELSEGADSARLARRFQASVSALRFELHLETDQAEITALAEDLAQEIEALRVQRPD